MMDSATHNGAKPLQGLGTDPDMTKLFQWTSILQNSEEKGWVRPSIGSSRPKEGASTVKHKDTCPISA